MNEKKMALGSFNQNINKIKEKENEIKQSIYGYLVRYFRRMK